MSDKIAIRYNEKNICRLPFISNTKVNKEDIIAGINYIDAEYWKEAKEHLSVKQKLENGIIEEVKTKSIQKEIEVEEIKKVKDEEGKEIDKKVMSKKNIAIKVTEFNKLNVKEKEDMIEETFSIKSLEEFRDNEEDASIRYKIEKRIDKIKNAKKDDTIGHPKSHLKG